MTLPEKLKELGVEITPEFTGAFIREGAQWFKGIVVHTSEGPVQVAYFGNHKTGKQGEWQSAPNESAEVKATIKQHNDVAREERERYWAEVAPEIEKEFYEFADTGTTPYLERKQLTGLSAGDKPNLFGARIKPNPNGEPILIVPLADETGKIWNYQRIYAQKLSKGDKFFLEGARIDGLYHILQRPTPDASGKCAGPSSLYLAEGFATAASVALALGDPDAVVACAFNAGNLLAAANRLRLAFPSVRFTICADNDAYTVIEGKPVNVGLIKAKKAAGAVGASVRYPTFSHPAPGLTDFNDLYLAEGRDRCLACLQSQPTALGIASLDIGYTKSGKPIAPTEQQVADHLLKFYDGKIVKEDRTLFLYTGSHWQELTEPDIDKIKLQIASVAGGELSSGEQDSYFKTFYRNVDAPPRGISLWTPRDNAANFKNGTLHLITAPGKPTILRFLPHARENYLRTVLPFEYPTAPLASIPSPEFDQMLERMWAQDPEKETIKRLVKQVMGACLIPSFHRIIMFIGPPASGKSTIIKLLQLLLTRDVFCSLAPHRMFGFHMESMIGKLVNLVTELPANRPMNDEQLKMLIDGTAQIERKFKTAIVARVPSLHVFAANKLPVSEDQGGNAYGRRMIVVKTGSFEAPEKYQRDFEQWLIAKEGQGIVARALEGLADLTASDGHFVVTSSSKEQVDEIHLNADLVGQFFHEISEGEVLGESGQRMVLGPNAEVLRSQLWSTFDAWQKTNWRGKVTVGKIAFYREVVNRKLCGSKMGGKDRNMRYFVGVGHCVSDDTVG